MFDKKNRSEFERNNISDIIAVTDKSRASIKDAAALKKKYSEW